MLRTQIIGLVLIVGLGVSAIASATDKPLDNRFYVAPMATYGFFHEDTFKPDDGIGAQISLGKTLTKHLALELYAFNYNDIDTKRGSSPVNVDILGYGLSALLFPARDVFPVFGIVGVGAGQNDFDPAKPIPGTGGLNNQDSDFVDVGIGFLAPINDFGVAIRGEYRYRMTDVDAPGGGDYKFRDNIVSLGLQIPLGAKPKAAPPPVAPTPTPEPQPAPVAAADSDGDGVPDNRDQCPGTPPGTQVTDNGCPADKQAPVVLKGVTFQFNSANLTEQAERRLDNVVNALQGSPDIHVRIEGHTDSIGSAAYNLKLSQQRADSVQAYLLSHGVAASRMAARGYGETRPVSPNTKPNGKDNPAGRALNRRVELHVAQ